MGETGTRRVGAALRARTRVSVTWFWGRGAVESDELRVYEYDSTFKLLLQSSAARSLRELTSGSIAQSLNVELPELGNRRADMLGETAEALPGGRRTGWRAGCARNCRKSAFGF